jgi:hypothetical protein
MHIVLLLPVYFLYDTYKKTSPKESLGHIKLDVGAIVQGQANNFYLKKCKMPSNNA